MSKVLLAWLLAIGTTRLAAQSGVPIGSAAAGLGTGVAVARDADAVFWNPALVGVQPFSDVRTEPGGSLRLLSISVPRAATRDWIVEGSRVGLLDGGPREAPTWTRLVSPGGGGGTGAELANEEEIIRMKREAVQRLGIEPPRELRLSPDNTVRIPRTASVRLRVRADGSVDAESVRLERPTNRPELNDEFVRVARAMRFRPARVEGAPVSAWTLEFLSY